MKKRLIAFVAVLFGLGGSLFAQNLIVNGDFEAYNIYGQITAPSYTDYARVNGAYVVEYGHYVIDNTTNGHGGGYFGWPAVQGHGGSGKFMMVNGFGGSTNPTKVVWKQTVSVNPSTLYSFSCFVVNFNRVIYGQINPAKLQLKINGVAVGGENQLPQDNYWHEWAQTWESGTATQAVIEIYDYYTGEEGRGDDFGLDDITFVPQAQYSVNAIDDNASVCLYNTVQVDVMANDIFSPNSNGATVTVIQQPAYGSATVQSNKIRYMFMDASHIGDIAQVKYRVTIPHGEYDDAWVYISTVSTPNVGWIDNPGPICAGGALGIDEPTVTPFALGHWEKCQTQSGTYVDFDATNIPISMNGWWVRYTASNDCGEGNSNSQQITVTNGPSFTGQTPQVQPICAGGSLNLTPPAFNANSLPIISQGWVISQTENGTYNSFNLNNISATYNGWYICYMVESSCGAIYSTPKRQLTVNSAPDVTGTLQAPSAICAGDDLVITPPDYSGNGTGSWEISQAQNGTYQAFSLQSVPVTYNNWYLHYKVSNDCGSDVSNAVQIHVYDAPTIGTPATPQAICAGGSFTLTTPSIQNNGSTITNQGWQIAASQNGTYTTFNNNNIPYTNNGYWIRYFAENDCGETHSVSVQVTVNDEPLVGPVTAPAGICAGQSFSLTVPTIQWRHVNQGTGSWEIQINGVWQDLTNTNIPFAYNGCAIRYKAVNGCGTAYSTNTVQVTVYSTEPTYDTITACDTYVWNGVTCNHTGNYQAQVQNENGCTITAHLHFIMSDAYTETQTVSVCNSYTWPKNGMTYNSSGNYEYIVESGNPLVCDSVFTLYLTINHAPQITSNISAPSDICSGSPLSVVAPQYVFNHVEGGDAHWEYSMSQNGQFTSFDPSTINLSYGTYYLRFAVSNACGEVFSNVVSFHVNDAPQATMQLSPLQVCEGQSLELPNVNVVWNNTNENDRVAQWQMAATQNGTYAQIDPTMPMQMSHSGNWLRFWVHNSCGDDIVGPVRITVLPAEDQWLETITSCDSYQLESGEVITESQVIEYEVYEPCFHIVHQPIEINYSDHVMEPITSCHETFEWHGQTFYHSDQTQYGTITLTNMQNCDSVVELQLDFDEYSSYTHNRTACDSYVWEMKPDYVYTESTHDSLFVPAVGPDDCDTWYFLELTLGHNSINDGGSMTECSGFVWHGIPYYENAVVYDTLYTTVTHCDSIIFYNLNIIPPQSGEENIVSCKPMWWQGHYCEEEGDYQHIFQSVQGCDSIVTMHFSITPEIEVSADTLACDVFNWHGHVFDGDGQWAHTFLTPDGCDSTVYLNVTFVQPEIESTEFSACNQYEFNGVVYDQPGFYPIYHDTVFTQNGCISAIQLLNLTIKDLDHVGMISGSSSVYVASSLISGVYRYEIDTEGLVGDVVWTLSNPEWQVLESGENYCRILVTTPGTANLVAHFQVAECGEMDRVFEINAGYFDVDELENQQVQVYPNPTKGTVHIEAEGIESVRLTSMMGQVLEMRDCGCSNSFELNLNGYAPSVYLLEIKTTVGVVKKRLVVCR